MKKSPANLWTPEAGPADQRQEQRLPCGLVPPPPYPLVEQDFLTEQQIACYFSRQSQGKSKKATIVVMVMMVTEMTRKVL